MLRVASRVSGAIARTVHMRCPGASVLPDQLGKCDAGDGGTRPCTARAVGESEVLSRVRDLSCCRSRRSGVRWPFGRSIQCITIAQMRPFDHLNDQNARPCNTW